MANHSPGSEVGAADPSPELRVKALAFAAIAGQSLFVAGCFALGLVEGHGYSLLAHDVSDLGAITAHHALVVLGVDAISGAAAIAFALGALVPALRLPGRRVSVGACLVALSLPALDNFSDTFFRVDCRAADPGCSSSDAFRSWHGQAHAAFFVIALIATVITPFVLARRMALVDGWGDLARPTRRFGATLIACLLLNVVTSGTSVQGLTQRIAIVVACGGVIALAFATLERTGGPPR